MTMQFPAQGQRGRDAARAEPRPGMKRITGVHSSFGCSILPTRHRQAQPQPRPKDARALFDGRLHVQRHMTTLCLDGNTCGNAGLSGDV
jgi:hypothetical protein